MGIARRVYLYGIALIALGMLVAGLSGLLETALTALVEYLVPLPPSLGEPQLRSRISLSGALAAIGLIAWLIHWGLADRAVRRGGEGGAVERRSGIRKLFLYAALFAGGLLLTFALAGLIRDLLLATFGRLTGADLLTGSITEPVARIAVVGAFWVYYTRVARSDRAIQPEVGAGATLRRWCVYALSLTGLLLALFSATGLIRLIWETVVPVPGATALTPDGVGIEVAGRTGSLVAGLILWAGHWRWATAWFQQTGGADPEARSVLRKVYLYLVLAVAVGWTVWNLGGILNRLLRMALISDPVATGWAGVLHEAGAAIAPALVFGVGWLYHARVVGREAALAGERHRQATIRWTYLYLVALIGLVTFAVGLAGVASTLVDLAAQPGALRPTHWWEDRISLFGTLALVGLPLWAFHW
ncbi:MAG TPA: DUF5671 domain-containing protein, partial [Dehalococcoidia bacterium]|nr:DUF5671 domain-containing protein [Dehalococcoidia bacterium]